MQATTAQEEQQEDPTLRNLVVTLLGFGALFVYLSAIYVLLAISTGNGYLSALGVVAIIWSVVLLYRLSKRLIKFVPK
jgi:hypothetical protein